MHATEFTSIQGRIIICYTSTMYNDASAQLTQKVSWIEQYVQTDRCSLDTHADTEIMCPALDRTCLY